MTLFLLVTIVLVRAARMKKQGITAMKFGSLDRSDFLIPPFALFYLYTVFARAFDLPSLSHHMFFHAMPIAWIGVLLCLAGLCLFVWSLISFGRSFRVGIDTNNPDRLVTDGIFALSRNPTMLLSVSFWSGNF